MPKFAANLTTLFQEAPFLDRFGRAAAAGFDAVEFLFPYAHPPAEIGARLRDHGLKPVLFNAPPGDFDAGERGLAGLAGREREFRDSVERALPYIEATGVPCVHVMAGRVSAGADPDAARSLYITHLRHAAAAFGAAGAKTLIEPLNRFDMPGYLLGSLAEAEAVVDEAGVATLAIQFDIYHAQRTSGELAASLQRLLPKIGHVQIADTPGRHEPGSGEIHYPFLFGHLDRIGYDGWVGCEYFPSGATEASFGWLRAERARAGSASAEVDGRVG